MLVMFFRAFICFSSLHIVFLDIRPAGEPFYFTFSMALDCLSRFVFQILGSVGAEGVGKLWEMSGSAAASAL